VAKASRPGALPGLSGAYLAKNRRRSEGRFSGCTGAEDFGDNGLVARVAPLNQEIWRERMIWPKKYGVMCLAIWLVLTGVMAVTSFEFSHHKEVLAVLAIVAGVLLWLDR
jgi:hypothetical protein